MERISLRGMGVALITPFKSTKEIDFEALARMTAHVINGKADYIVVLGTTSFSEWVATAPTRWSKNSATAT